MIERVVSVKNISGGPIPAHDPPCSQEVILAKQPPTSTPRSPGDLPHPHRLAFCPGCAIPMFDSTEFRFSKDEEVLLPERVAQHLVAAWKNKLALSGKPISLQTVLASPEAIYEMGKDGKLRPKKMQLIEPRKQTLENVSNPKARILSEVET